MVSNYNGFIPINKPKGMTSHDVVSKVRKILGIKKVGHTGTLDPEVTGVLPIAIGKATRLSEYVMELPKTYVGQLTLGISTNTQDFTGDIIEESIVEYINENRVNEVFKSFIGEIEQIPPMYSAVRVNGKRLYELARKDKKVDIKPRKVTIYNIKILEVDNNPSNPTIDFEVTCSKGTYIRTLCVDIGKKLGYPAHMSKLTRTNSGGISIDKTVSLEDLAYFVKINNVNKLFISMTESLPQFAGLIVSDEQIERQIFNGQTINLDTLIDYEGLIKIIDNNRNLVALYKKNKNEDIAKPEKVFK